MRLSFPNPTSFLLLLLPLQTISSPAPEPIPGGLAIQTGPITVPVLSFGGAVAAIQGSRVYYQGADGALHELVGSGSPSPTNNYNDQIILPAGKARIASPLAVVDYNNNLQIHIFYIGIDDRLREYYYDRGWRDGTINAANITTRSGSRCLWIVLAPAGPGSGPGPFLNQGFGPGPGARSPRVGFVAPNGDLSEAALEGNTWVTRPY